MENEKKSEAMDASRLTLAEYRAGFVAGDRARAADEVMRLQGAEAATEGADTLAVVHAGDYVGDTPVSLEAPTLTLRDYLRPAYVITCSRCGQTSPYHCVCASAAATRATVHGWTVDDCGAVCPACGGSHE